MGTSHKSDFIYMHTRDLAMPFFFNRKQSKIPKKKGESKER